MAMAPISPVNDLLTKISNAQMSNDKKIMKMNVASKVDAATAGAPRLEGAAADAQANGSSRLDVHV